MALALNPEYQRPCVCCRGAQGAMTRAVFDGGRAVMCCIACFPTACFHPEVATDSLSVEGVSAHETYVNTFKKPVLVVANRHSYLVEVTDCFQASESLQKQETLMLSTCPPLEHIIGIRSASSTGVISVDDLKLHDKHPYQTIALQRVLQYCAPDYDQVPMFDPKRPPRFALLKEAERPTPFASLCVSSLTVFVPNRKFIISAVVILDVM